MKEIHFLRLLPALESPGFVSIKIQSDSDDLPDISAEQLHGEGLHKVFQVSGAVGFSTRFLDASQVVTAIGAWFEEGYHRAILETEMENIIYTRTPKGVRIQAERKRDSKAREDWLRFGTAHLVESTRIRAVLAELGILAKTGAVKRDQYNKLIQIKNFLRAVHGTLARFQDRECVRVVDGACGKSYLSFVLYHFLREEWGFDARFQCIDTSDRIIGRCREIQSTLSYPYMDFTASTLDDFRSDGNIDLLYSLHGCDTATDEAIAAGVRMNSQVIIMVPCCHLELRRQLRRHPLKALTKSGLLEERFAALLTDALRMLILEAVGYDVAAFRFVTDDISPKNTLIRALKRESRNSQALEQYRQLRDMFGVSPEIERLLPAALVVG